jgi:hypothetical protein
MKKIILILSIIGSLAFSAKAQKVEFNKTLKSYFDLKNALATDNVEMANTNAKILLTAIKSFPVQKLGVHQQEEWKKYIDELKKNISAIVSEKDLKRQRKSFEGVVYPMIKITKGLHLNNNDVYVQYCPMIKRSWLNEVEEVQNPFYGSQMYDCGEVTDTISKR